MYSTVVSSMFIATVFSVSLNFVLFMLEYRLLTSVVLITLCISDGLAQIPQCSFLQSEQEAQ